MTKINFQQLFIFVEGPDDERFVDLFIKPFFEKSFNFVKIIKYACKTPDEIKKLINVIKNNNKSDYIYLCDMDARGNKGFCITNRKANENKKINDTADLKKIFVVKEEIESWYLSGVSPGKASKYKIKLVDSTENLTKEKFQSLIPKSFKSKNDFMIEILKDYSVEQAVNLNSSLKYFLDKISFL